MSVATTELSRSTQTPDRLPARHHRPDAAGASLPAGAARRSSGRWRPRSSSSSTSGGPTNSPARTCWRCSGGWTRPRPISPEEDGRSSRRSRADVVEAAPACPTGAPGRSPGREGERHPRPGGVDRDPAGRSGRVRLTILTQSEVVLLVLGGGTLALSFLVEHPRDRSVDLFSPGESLGDRRPGERDPVDPRLPRRTGPRLLFGDRFLIAGPCRSRDSREMPRCPWKRSAR